MATIALARGRSKNLSVPTAGNADSAAVTADFIRAISNPVVASQEAPLERPSKYRSRFFFRLPETPKEEVERLQAATANSRRKATETIDDIMRKRVDAYREEFPDSVSKNIDKVREFFLKEINPLIMASSTGAAQAQDIIQRLLGFTVDGAPYNHFDKLVRRAVQLRMTKFISSYFKVDQEKLLAQLTESQPKDVLLLHGQGQEANRKRGSKPVPGAVRK